MANIWTPCTTTVVFLRPSQDRNISQDKISPTAQIHFVIELAARGQSETAGHEAGTTQRSREIPAPLHIRVDDAVRAEISKLSFSLRILRGMAQAGYTPIAPMTLL